MPNIVSLYLEDVTQPTKEDIFFFLLHMIWLEKKNHEQEKIKSVTVPVKYN